MPTAPQHRINFTKAALAALPSPPVGRIAIHDEKTPGLMLRITAAGCRTFQVYRKLRGRPVRVTLGRFPPLTVEQARRLAAATLAKLAEGINPNHEKREQQARAITLSEVLTDYLDARRLKQNTIKLYRWLVEDPAGAFSDWKTRPLASITRDLVERRHLDKGQKIALAVEIEPHFAEEARKRMAAGGGDKVSESAKAGKGKSPLPGQGQSRDQAAATVGLSELRCN